MRRLFLSLVSLFGFFVGFFVGFYISYKFLCVLGFSFSGGDSLFLACIFVGIVLGYVLAGCVIFFHNDDDDDDFGGAL